VEDALSLGASFKITGAPFFVESRGNTGPDSNSNFNIMYTQGNIQAQIASLIANSKAKIVNAPRVVVQNGSGAAVMFTESIPFITTSESTDIYGRITSSPQITMQTFSKGLIVQNATILPDNSVILVVEPQLDDPGQIVALPGSSDTSSGGVSGSTSTQIQAVVRVKNGESMMMGGFVSTNEGEASYRVPLLSDLPIIGPLLFRSTNKTKNNTETLFFLTPTIIFDDKTSFDGMTSIPPVF